MSTASTRAARNTADAAASGAASQTTSGAGTEVIKGRMVKGASLPSVSGRGRRPGVLPEWFTQIMTEILTTGEGVYEFEGTPKKVISHKNTFVKKFVEAHNKANDKKIRARYVTVEGSLPSASNAGTENVKIACVVEYLDTDSDTEEK